MNKDLFDLLLAAMLEGGAGISDLLFIPGRPPQLDCYGRLRPFEGGFTEAAISPQLTEQIAAILMEGNERLAENLKLHGSCDCSYALPGVARFRVNVYRQSGHLSIVMRKLSNIVPELDKLGLPAVFAEIIKERTGLVFVTGATGMGKTTTLAAVLNELNKTQEIHIITLEDPVEFLHTSVKASFSQREFGKDFFSYPVGLKAALRQAPKAILVGEIRDRETMDVAITAAETGHIVFTTLHTINAAQTVNRILGMFDKDEEPLVRQRLADTLRWVVSQRLVTKVGGGLHLVSEIMGSNLRTREVIQLGESDKRNLHEIIEQSVTPWGWHSFEQSLLKAFEGGYINEETAVLHATHKNKIRQSIDHAKHTRTTAAVQAARQMMQGKR
ncbi:MAG: PilT/PilU family type 4a pilus ATPase [Verrucomicrobia bacterium]|nr:PilT/PilU family type 4a pilus ATPase [Verrucomicrobiota bacterium]